jgi:hypothetical protein
MLNVSIDPPGFLFVAATSVAGTVVASTALVMKYGVRRVIEAIPSHACEIGFVLGGLLSFNLTFFLLNVLSCDCSAWASH